LTKNFSGIIFKLEIIIGDISLTKKLISLGSLIIIPFLFAACTPRIPWHGIPKGEYRLADENGVVYGDGGESAWYIRENDAEYSYLTYKIIEEDGKFYFEVNMSDNYTCNGMRYTASYDKNSKILTVYMSSTKSGKSPLTFPDMEAEIVAFLWKIKD
jgi:hypothetical protein